MDNKLTLLKRIDKDYSLYKCSCGNEKKIRHLHVNRNKTRSCGCLQRKHGKCSRIDGKYKRDITWITWQSMKARCYNPSSDSYCRYGAIGVTVCERWLGEDGFANFLEDMGDRPDKEYTLHRKKNAQVYCKENCVWADSKTQGRERERVVSITYNGETKSVSEWAEKYGIEYSILYCRVITQGKSMQVALSMPIKKTRKRTMNRLIEYGGELKTILEWAKELGIKYETLRTRINDKGWSVERALTTKVNR